MKDQFDGLMDARVRTNDRQEGDGLIGTRERQWSSYGHGVTLLSQPHWFHGIIRAWRDASAPSEGQRLQTTHTTDMCGQELAQECNTSATTPIAVQHSSVH